MKKHLGIIKELGLFSLLFVLVSAVAVSEEADVSVTTIEITSSEDSSGTNTVITTYDSSGNGLVITDDKDTIPTESTDSEDNSNEGDNVDDGDTISTESTDSNDSGANGNLNPDATLPDFQFNGLTYKEYNDDWSDWIMSVMDKDPLVMISDFPQDINYMINF